MDQNQYYLASDNDLLLDIFKSELNFLKSSWQHMLGRPVVVVTIRSIHLGIVTLLCVCAVHFVFICVAFT